MAKQSDRKSSPEDVSAIARLSDYTVHSDSPETWTAQGEPPEVAADYGKLGEHVTSVLEAANQAAATIRDEARTTAKDIVERAQREASTWLEKARAETEELSHEAGRLRIEAPGQFLGQDAENGVQPAGPDTPTRAAEPTRPTACSKGT